MKQRNYRNMNKKEERISK